MLCLLSATTTFSSPLSYHSPGNQLGAGVAGLMGRLAGEADDVPSLGLRSLVAKRGDLLPDPADDAVRNRGHQVEGLPGEQGDRARKEHEEEDGTDDADADQSDHGVHEGREEGTDQRSRRLHDDDGQEHRDHEQRGPQQRAEEQHVAHAAVLSGKTLALGQGMEVEFLDKIASVYYHKNKFDSYGR